MGNELIKINGTKEVNTIDSREVAEMLETKHYKILEKLEGTKDGKTKGIIPILTNHNFVVSDYFLESTYKDKSGKDNKCYLITKLGCDFLANKFTGEKGILFTASYVKRFNDMEKALTNNLLSFQIEDPIKRAEKWIEEQKQTQLLLSQKDEIIEELSPLAELARKRIDTTGTVSITDVTKSFNLKRGQVTVWAKTNGYIHKTLTEVNNKGDEYFKIVCPDGEHKNIAITESGLKLIDKNISDIKNSPCRFKVS